MSTSDLFPYWLGEKKIFLGHSIGSLSNVSKYTAELMNGWKEERERRFFISLILFTENSSSLLTLRERERRRFVLCAVCCRCDSMWRIQRS